MKKIRIKLSFFAVFILLLFVVIHFVSNVQAAETKLDVLLDDEIIEEIQLEKDEKVTLNTKLEGMSDATFQWQLMQNVQEAVWVNIYDRTENDCEVSYALVKNILDDADSVYIRCAATHEGDTVYSAAVCVMVKPEEEQVMQTAVYDREEEIALFSETALSDESTDEESEYVTITIKYLDHACYGKEEETAIYSPYVARIQKGTKFQQNIVSPTFLGFAPFLVNEDGTKGKDAATLDLNLDSVQENQVYYVYYYPIEVNYAIRYYFQNVADDLYTEDVARYTVDKAETGTIISNDTLTGKAGDTKGFTKMYHIPENVAADGSTVFECYYDRNYYLMEFDLNGGYGVEPIYARYGAAFVVNEPVRHGYTFDGWKLVQVDMDEDGQWDKSLPTDMSTELVSNIPYYNCQYEAQWKTIETSYTVVYWLERKDGTSQYLTGRTVTGVQSGSKVSGKDDLKDCLSGNEEVRYYEYVRADENVTVEGDGSTIVNVYYKPKEYTLRFYYAAKEGEKIKIIGGSTYYFGYQLGENTSEDAILLNRVFQYSNVGEVTELPALNSVGESRGYTKGEYTTTGSSRTYYYIEFEAEYGQNISELWPCSVFEPTKRTEITSNKNEWDGTQAFVAGWNGEHHVAYSRNGNETIKGKYEKLDSAILFHSDYEDETTVSYLCFWENGAGYVTWNVPYLFVYRIWVPVLPGEDETGPTIKEYGNVTYKLIDSYDTCDNSTVKEQTIPSLEGYTNIGKEEATDITFTAEQTNSYKDRYGVDFFYKRNENEFVMKNYDEEIVKTQVEYGYLLSGLDKVKQLGDGFVPSYPKTLEENAYEFEGWYTTEQCIEGTKVDLKDYRMPDSGLMLFANWVPKKHTVNFFTTYDEMKLYEEGKEAVKYRQCSVPHGNVIGAVDTPTREAEGGLSLIFAGWFYMEAGQKKAFSPLNIPVHKDLNLFAEWSSHSPQPYRIRYVQKGNPDIAVADDTTGYAYGGSTRTFYAKAGNPYHQLHDAYNKGWFPTVSSHSITIQAEADKENLKHNTYTFYYVAATDIQYTVRYVDKETNKTLKEDKILTTSDAVVTERFLAIDNMVPDAFYKRLVLEVKEDEHGNYVGTENNVITFYYTKNETSAFYAVHYMLEKLDATEDQKNQYKIDGTGGYKETDTHTEAVGTIGQTISVNPQVIPGFELIDDKDVPKVKYKEADTDKEVRAEKKDGGYEIKITKDGTELFLFYKRKTYPYQVHYYEYNTTKSVADSKTACAPYGCSVAEDAINISGKTCVSERTQTITIRDDENGTKNLNIIIFYYAPIQYVVEYKAVPEEGGQLSKTIEVTAGKDFEGSVPTPGEYYRFVGWYQDEACTQPVTSTLVGTDNKLDPKQAELSDTKSNIFYAKFERRLGEFTIQREGCQDQTQVFVYEVKNVDTGETICVTVTGNGSTTIKDLPFGRYTVTQQNDWSWRYEDGVQTFTHTPADGSGTTCSFQEPEKNQSWLNGNSKVKKNQRRRSE